MRDVRPGLRRTLLAAQAGLLCTLFAAPAHAAEGSSTPVAGAFVYPVGDEVDYSKPAPGEAAGFHISDPYLALRGKRKLRRHYGVDLANGRGGCEVRAVATGVVVVSDGNALVRYRKAQRLRLPSVVHGKRTYKWGVRYRTAYKWRTGWGNRVVIRHVLRSGEIVYSLYAHLKPRSVIVRVGDVVAAGQPIACVGRTGHATSAHLHLEIRRSAPQLETEDPDGEGEEELADGGPSARENAIASSANGTMDPVAFLDRHVVRFADLSRGSWQARYALAAARDGILVPEAKKFEPDDEITRADFYGALVSAFHLGTPFTRPRFESSLDALVDAGLLDRSTARRQRADEHLARSDALELVLRCADRRAGRGRSLAQIQAEILCRDFNRQFAGADAAAQAERGAKAAAFAETRAREKAAWAKAERDRKWAKAVGKKVRIRVAKVKPVAPTYTLDPGFKRLAESDKRITRAEAALLFASALRMDPKQLSALERAASRASATSG